MSNRQSKWDALRTRLPSACFLEETGLDPSAEAQQYAGPSRGRANKLHRLKNERLATAAAPAAKVCIGGLEGLLEDMNSSEEIEMEQHNTDGESTSAKLPSPADHDSQVEAPLLDVRLAETNLYPPPRVGARNRWRRLKHTVAFANHLANVRNSNNDLLDEKVLETESKADAGHAGAAASGGAKTTPQVKARGRKGMEGLIVEQDKGYLSYFQDFYVACLKMSACHFFIGVFLAPVALALMFTPFYLSDIEGLKSGDEGGPLCANWGCLNVFLYSLSLSTTFGGSPIAAISPFCLLMANLHTLMAQFLFVFLSGAVFARMSQPAHPIRCSKKAIVKDNDYAADQSDEDAKSKVFVVRMVLTGPPPCELVDAKIRLTFRIYVRLPSGSMFCSTQDLELVRSEVAYLRYGLTIRHVINSKSPIYGHTLDSLAEGDASFSLTVMGVERSSMQPIFHLEDYFICDGDVVWDGEYLDFVRVNDKGQRVLDHSKIDMLKPFKVAGVVTQAIARMEGEVGRHKSEINEKEMPRPSETDWKNSGLRIRKLWKSMSTSFTRAMW